MRASANRRATQIIFEPSGRAGRMPLITGLEPHIRAPNSRVATEMALHVLAYNLTRVINIMGPGPLITAIKT
jgi:hypothetical protein